jgi:hypothetical protein
MGSLSRGEPPGRQDLTDLRSCHERVEDHLYAERALLPEDVFRVLHYLKHGLSAFSRQVEAHLLPGAAPTGEGAGGRGDLRQSYEELNRQYERLLGLVQIHLGVT